MLELTLDDLLLVSGGECSGPEDDDAYDGPSSVGCGEGCGGGVRTGEGGWVEVGPY